MKLFLHIGLPKTASTFLQATFARHDRIGYLGRPYTQENRSFNQLQYAFDGAWDPVEFADGLAQWRSGFTDQSALVISDEMLAGFPAYNFINRSMIADRLAQSIPDAEIILYLRNQRDLLLSLYNHYVKIGWITHPLDTRFVTAPGTGMSLTEWQNGKHDWNRSRRFIDNRSFCSVEHFRFSTLLALYHQRFAKVHVFLFEDLQCNLSSHLNRLGTIMSVTDLGQAAEDLDSAKNASLSDADLVLQLATNRLSDFRPKVLKHVLVPLVAMQHRDVPARARRHVDDVLQQANLMEDNKSINVRYNLGMEHHAGYALA